MGRQGAKDAKTRDKAGINHREHGEKKNFYLGCYWGLVPARRVPFGGGTPSGELGANIMEVAEAVGRPVRMPDKLPDKAVVSCPLSVDGRRGNGLSKWIPAGEVRRSPRRQKANCAINGQC